MFALDDRVLVASADGVGTKLKIAFLLDKHDTIGRDLVNHCVDDVLTTGAKPLFFLDYFATGVLEPRVLEEVVAGLAGACREAGCALLGGETAEHPGVMEPHHYDLSATGVGVVEADAMLGPDRVRPGDTVVAMAASGLHSNGYSLARQVLLEIGRMSLDGHVEEFGRTLGDELLEPTRIYARDCLAVAAETDVRTFAHVTGGGLCANLVRVVPTGLTAELDRTTWTPAPVFKLIASRGRVTREEMERTFNMGVGMVAVLPPDDVDRAMAVLTAKHVPSWVIGEVRATSEADAAAPDSGHAVLRGDHPRF
jgi:phosphoribosylformylglycinamidine cyclo-ligase